MNERWEISDNKGIVEAKFFRNDFQVYRFTACSMDVAISRLADRDARIRGLSLMLNNRADANNLIGRPVYYREIPAIIVQFDGERGMVMLRADNIETKFPPEPWDGEGAEASVDVREELLSPKIYWHREESE